MNYKKLSQQPSRVNSKRRVLALACCFLTAVASLWGSASAQVFDSYLQPEFDDPTLPGAPGASWLGDPELRIKPEFNNGSRNTASYSVRFRPRPNKQRRLDQHLFTIENAQLKLAWQQHYSELVAQRYLSVLTLAEAEAQLWQLEQGRIAARSRVSAERALAGRSSSSGGATSVQQAILRYGLAENRVEQVRQRVVLLRKQSLGAYFEPKAEDVGLSARLVAPAQVATMLPGLVSDVATTAQVLQAARLNNQQAAERLSLERTQSRFGLSLLELGFDDKQDDSYNLTLGFRIPSRRSSSGEARRARELIEAEQEAHLITESYTQKLHTKLSLLRLEIDYFKLHTAALSRHRTQLSNATRSDASAQQMLREHELELQGNVISAHAKVLRGYVDLLAFSGQLYPTNTNWLRAQQN